MSFTSTRRPLSFVYLVFVSLLKLLLRKAIARSSQAPLRRPRSQADQRLAPFTHRRLGLQQYDRVQRLGVFVGPRVKRRLQQQVEFCHDGDASSLRFFWAPAPRNG